MMKSCFIGVDQGSSSTKAIIVDLDGIVIAEARRDLSPPLRNGTKVEHDPEEVFTSVRESVEAAAGQARSTGHTILGMGLSCQRSSCLAWNGETGDPLSPVLSWRDTRGSATVDRLLPKAPLIFERTGLPLTPYYSASKLRWLRDDLTASREREAVLGTLSSFLCQRLTGSSAPLIDHTNAARTQLMDIGTLSWDPELVALFGLEGARLPRIVPTAHRYGMIETSGGSVPLLASVGDQQAAMLGLGVLAPGRCGINYGTGGFLMVPTGPRLLPVPRLIASVLYSTGAETQYLLEGSVNAVGDALAWLRSNLGLFREFSEIDGLCRAATTDVVAFLGLNGTGAPHWERDTASAIEGLNRDSTAADIVRAAVEGIAFFMADIAAALSAAGAAPESVTVSGGLSSLRYLAEAQAALLGVPLAASSGRETSALGAAYVAGISAGAWTPADCGRFAPASIPIAPLDDSRLPHRYRRWKELHRSTVSRRS